MHKQFLTKQDFETYYCGTVRSALIAVLSHKLVIILWCAKDSFHGVVLRFTTTIQPKSRDPAATFLEMYSLELRLWNLWILKMVLYFYVCLTVVLSLHSVTTKGCKRLRFALAKLVWITLKRHWDKALKKHGRLPSQMGFTCVYGMHWHLILANSQGSKSAMSRRKGHIPGWKKTKKQQQTITCPSPARTGRPSNLRLTLCCRALRHIN